MVQVIFHKQRMENNITVIKYNHRNNQFIHTTNIELVSILEELGNVLKAIL